MEIDQIAAVLESNDFGRFIGAAEGAVFEVKSAPYNLDLPADRYELAKDVSSLANGRGGYLLIGLGTHRPPDRPVDLVNSIALLPAHMIDIVKYEGIISTYVYPRIEGLSVRWHQQNGSADGIASIRVPVQDEDKKLFMIAKVVEDNEHIKEIVAGVVERNGASSDPITPKRLQEWLKKGRDSHSSRLTRMERMLEELYGRAMQPTPAGPAATFDREQIQQRIDAALAEEPHPNTPTYVIAASVSRGHQVRQFYSDIPDSARFMLREAGQLREMGFDLTIGSAAQVGRDGCWEARQGERKSLRLYDDGTLVFRVAADETFLGWGQDTAPFLRHPRLNPFSVVEVHASFASFYPQVLQRLKDPPNEVLVRLFLANVVVGEGRRLFMTRLVGRGTQMDWIDQNYFHAAGDPAVRELTVPAADFIARPNVWAFNLLHQFFDMFDMGDDLIPFTIEVDGIRQVDFDAIRRWGNG